MDTIKTTTTTTEAMDHRNLEVTVLSAEDLRVDGKPVKRNSFVVVNKKKSTRADCHGGSFPSWNEKLVVPMPPVGCRSLALDVRIGGGAHDRVVGSAIIPLSDFLGDYTPEGYLHFLSYRLRDSLGRKNGIVNVSVKVDGGRNCGYGECSSSLVAGLKRVPAVVGVPAATGGVVMGIPVWGTSRA